MGYLDDARIARVDNNHTIFMNRGEVHGVQVFDKFADSAGIEVTDPETGELLGVYPLGDIFVVRDVHELFSVLNPARQLRRRPEVGTGLALVERACAVE